MVFKKKENNALKYLNLALSFGLTLAITVYLLYKAGTWLDQRLGTEPIFMMLGVFLALATIFWQLINEFKDLEPESKNSNQDKQKKT